MKKLLTRIVALLLVICLTADSVSARITLPLLQNAGTTTVQPTRTIGLFASEAFANRLLNFRETYARHYAAWTNRLISIRRIAIPTLSARTWIVSVIGVAAV